MSCVQGQVPMSGALACLTTAEMYAADRAAIEGGVPGVRLMDAAGIAVADAVVACLGNQKGRITVLCGPGNNGGDGFVAARHLRTRGYDVRLASLLDLAALKGDAAKHAAVWEAPVETLSPSSFADADVVVDALFGAGLSRALSDSVADTVRALNAASARVVAVDVPSGISGDTGEVVGDLAVHADRTVTFFRPKPGHLLYPGRGFCGELVIADIGIPETVLEEIAPRLWSNTPELWGMQWPWRSAESHKYTHGHAVVLGSESMSGAGRLAAAAALRTGAGLVTAAVPHAAIPQYVTDMPVLMTEALGHNESLDSVLEDKRKNAVLIGPGAGVTEQVWRRVAWLLADGRPLVLDADALTVVAQNCDQAVQLRAGPVVMTPHEGEFQRLFPEIEGNKLSRAREGAAKAGAVIVLKGADTVIATPDGRAAIASNAPPELATGGAGDVLAGMILGAIAQGLPAFEAACAAVWLHAEAASAQKDGLIASDILDGIPKALHHLRQHDARRS